jgi:ABC-type Na+ efflux pump permease subunit
MIRPGLILLGLFHLGNGLFMLAAPDAWYAAVPGVVQTGPINHHFITDIALAFAGSGAFMILGARARMAAFALAGATFPALHALFHVWEWIADGIPHDPKQMASDAVAVMLVSFLGFALAWLRAREEGVV